MCYHGAQPNESQHIMSTPLFERLESDAQKAAREGRRRGGGDCSVKAIAIACGISYDEALQATKQDRHRRGDYASWQGIFDIIRSYGFELKLVLIRPDQFRNIYGFETPKRPRFTAKTMITLQRELPSRGVFLIATGSGRHVAVARAGRIQDWTADRRSRVSAVWRVTKRST